MIPFFSIAAVVYIFDFVTKHVVRERLPLGAEIHLLPFFSLVHVRNTGVAFGYFQGNNAALLVVGLLMTFVLIYWGLQFCRQDRLSGFALALVLGGALGNLTDRFLFRNVTDFLDFFVRSAHWPSFNVADSAICVGAAVLVWRHFRR
jgi:signal peptidase II